MRMAALGLLTASFLTLTVQAQTTMTIKPFQVRIEVPVGSSGTFYVNPCNLRIPTNGASGTDPTGTNWVIANVNVSISGAPSGCTASLVDDGLANPVGAIPVNLNTGNTSSNTNLIVKLVFDGTQASGVTNLAITASGAGLPDDSFLLPLEVATIWNGSANAAANGAGSWSDGTQWLGGAPGPGDNVVFMDIGTQTNSLLNGSEFLTNSLVASSVTIASLRFSQTNGTGTIKTNWQNLFINPGATLSITGNDGFKMLRDYTYWSLGLENVSISGSGGTLVQSNENSSFSFLTDGDGKPHSLLDMSGLGNLYLDVNRLYLSDYEGYPNYDNLVYTNNYGNTSPGQGKPERFYQNWNMAMTNYIKATYVDPYNYTNALSRGYALTLGRNESSGGGSGQDCEIFMGYSNLFNLDSICIAGPSSLGSDFRFLNTGSYAKFRNVDGVSRMSIFATADDGGQPAADKSKCGGNGPGVDFTKGTVDMLVDRLYMSLDPTNDSGNYVQTSGFYFGAGIIDANTAILGYQSQGNAVNADTCYANVYVTNTAVLKVNNTLTLGYTTAAIEAPNASYGALHIGPGGTVMANNIAVGGVTKTSAGNNIAMLGNASLIVSNGIADATPYGALGTLSFAGGNNSLTLFIDGSKPAVPMVYVTNLTASGTGDELIIGGVANISTYPATIPLIAGVGPAISASVFDAGAIMPAGFHGTLITSSSNTINLIVLNRTPNNLLWRGPAGLTGTADWDYTTKNWLDQNSGLMTNYNDPDIVSFDDTPGYATNINLAVGPVLPGAINVTNNNLYYTISSSSSQQIIGGPVLNKQGTGTLEIDVNTTCSVELNQGVLTGFNPAAIGNLNVAAGAVMLFGGSLSGSLVCSGTASSYVSIAGTVSVLSGGVMTNAGTVDNPISIQSGGLLYNAGLLNHVGVGSSGSPQVASGGTLINKGTIENGSVLGDVLFVNGTFEDLGGPASSTLYSLSIGQGGTFIPGGDGIGTTTINSDGSGTFPGAALLAQGSTTIFKVNPATLAQTTLTCDHLSFGGSSSQRNQNGCTLLITNVSATPFSAGQSFHLFDNVYLPGTVPFSTGSSTNTFPVVVPATPGPGLAWDLSQLWASGNIGVIATPQVTLTNSMTVSGNKIISQFSWDAAQYGWRLETQANPLSVGLSTNWTGINGSWTNTSMTITNTLGNNAVYYRLVYP